MANYFGPNSAAWTARSGVVLDPEKNGPMSFNGAPNMNMIMSQAMILDHASQQATAGNPKMKMQLQSGSDLTGPTISSQSIPGLMNGHPTMPAQSGNNVIPQSYGGSMQSMGMVSSGMNPHMMLNAPQSVLNMNMMASNLPGMNLSGMNVTGQAMQGINSMARTMTPGLGMSTVGSMGVNMTRLPIMNANIPPSMFMQTVNFDSSQNQEDMNRTMESSMDLIEQQQAIEQSKLLHRFKELRQLQIQQQEMLMKQQQEQLESLRSEQQNIHSVMAKQRKNQWGGQVVNRDPGSQTRTPPQRQRPPGAALAKAMTMTQQSQQSFTEQANQSSLPCPVMYVPLNEDNDEIKTNPDLFSDTNSHAGSQSTEEAFHQLPDSASEIGELPQIPNKKPVSRVHVSGFHSSMKKSLTEELEQDEGIGTQSFKASGQTDYQTYRSSSPIEMDDDNDHQEDTQLEEQDLDQDDEDEDFDEEDEEEVTSNDGSDDQPIKSRALDDRPLAGIGEKKTFEELLEEQLKAEEDKMKSAALQGQNQDSPKRSFLKRGQGIARFGLQDKSKPIKDLKSIKPKVDSNSAQQIKSSKSDSQLDKPTKGDNAGKQQNKKGDNSTKQPKNIGKDEGPGAKKRGTWQQRNALNLKTSPAKNLKLKKSPNNKDDKVIGKGQKTSDLHEQKLLPNKQIIKESNKPPIKEEPQNGRQPIENVRGNINAQQKTGIREATQSPDSFPDDASFVAKIDERIRYEEVEKEDLDEFELLENCADNMSFCSQSSFVTRIFQKDKLRQETFKPPTQSPRQSVAMQLQATIKNATQQQQSLQTNLQGEYLSIPEENEPSSPQKQITSQRQLKDQDQVCEDSSEEEDEESEEEEDEDESEEDSSDETESEEDSDEYETDEEPQKSPTKIMTRKVASQNTVSNLLQKLKINQQNDSVASLNASTFVPNPKSPIVISKELTTANKPTSIQDESLDEADFKIHSQISSLRKSTESTSDGNNDSDDSENSYSNLKIIPKNVPKSNNDLDSKSTTDSDEKLRTESDDKHSSDFDDEEEWGDTTLKARSPSEKHKSSNEDTNEGTPPTSKLVAKLFPKLKPQPSKQQKEDQQKLQTINNTVFSDGVQSKVLRDKLAELEKEIEKFRSENINLDKLRKEREEGIQRLKKEISEFEREKSLELSRIQEYRNEEMKKIKHEKKMFEKYQKAARDIPNKKEREEIEVLKNQMTELQEEMKRKETRWTSSNSRLRSKIEQLEQENSELKEEIKLMEKRRLEWLQKEQNKVKSAVTSSTPTQPLPTQNSADFQTTDSDEEKDPVRDSSSSKTSNSQMSLRSTQSSTQVRTVGLPPSQPTQTVPAKTAPSSKNINEGPTKGAQPSLSNQQGLPKTVQPSFTNPGPSRTAQPSYTSHPGPSKPTQPNSISSQSKPPDHILRMSLMEDVPRGGAVTAVPQDTSLYTDTECDITNNGNVPRKTASKYSVDRSMIDKGNSGYDEFQHSDGKIERVYKTGAREILFPNGTRKEISADGKSIVVSFFNGDIKQIMPDQRVVYYYAEAQTTHSNYPDGLEVLQFPNNQVEKHYPDGTKEITFADQTIKYLFPNGSEESIFPDGTVIRVDKNGDKTMEFPNGQREIHTNEYKKREYPDGTVKTVYPDGRQETRYSNGRIRVKDRDGNVIVDRRC